VLVAGTKQKQTLGSPDCPVSLQALICARYLHLLLLFRVFLWQPLRVLTRQTRQMVRAINQYIFYMSMYLCVFCNIAVLFYFKPGQTLASSTKPGLSFQL
jgi:hypothetical protein